jgi:DNA ligase D-like protein (predicted 3'-phosphoesterase)
VPALVSRPFPNVTQGYHLGMRFSEYRRKRRFGRHPRFVIGHGAAGSDHYDLRLEIDGVLVSWAIPKDRRIARRTEDHPLEHAESAAIVGDRGTYANASPYEMTECLERGYLSFHLRGETLRGCYTLTRIREGEEETWLLIRRKGEDADTRPEPALTVPTLDDLS